MTAIHLPLLHSYTKVAIACLFLYLSLNGYAQHCFPVSTLPCTEVSKELPYRLSFDVPVANTITDEAGRGLGFTMVLNYTGTRLAQDGLPANPDVPGYQPSALSLNNNVLTILTNKGIHYLTNNNQLNALGVRINASKKFHVSSTLVKPYQGTSAEQAGIWLGLSDKTYIKLSVGGNKIELRREINDISTPADQRITGNIVNLSAQTVLLRLVVDPASATAEGYYSLDNGITYKNVGGSLNIKDMGIPGSTYTGIFASQRNATKAVTFNFDNFAVEEPAIHFENAVYSFQVSDTTQVNSALGTVNAFADDSSAITFRLHAGNTNRTFALDTSTGRISLAKKLNYHTQSAYKFKIVAYAGGQTDTATININVLVGQLYEDYSKVTWSLAAAQPYKVSEAQGEVVDGKLYCFGGFDSRKTTFTPTKRAYVYDPPANKWTPIADLPHLPNGNNFGGVTHAGITNDGTDIYFAGGYASNTSGTGQTFGVKQVWKYNVKLNTYTRLPDLPIVIAAGQLEYLNGKLHHIAGTNASRTQDLGNHYVLDLDNLAAGWKTLAALPNPRQHAGSAVFEGKIYYIGGQRGHDAQLKTLKDVHRYEPATNSWVKMANLLAPGSYGLGHISSSVVVMGGRIIVLGGEAVHQTNQTKMVSAYSVATNSWAALTSLPENRYSGVAAVLNGQLYYTGGSKASTTFKGTPVDEQRSAAVQTVKPTVVAAKTITIFPNPVYRSIATVKLQNFGKREQVTLSIIDTRGKLFRKMICYTTEEGQATVVIDAQLLPEAGMYMVQAASASGKAVGKLMVR